MTLVYVRLLYQTLFLSLCRWFGMLEDMVNKLIDLELSAPHSKVEVLGVIQDA